MGRRILKSELAPFKYYKHSDISYNAIMSYIECVKQDTPITDMFNVEKNILREYGKAYELYQSKEQIWSTCFNIKEKQHMVLKNYNDNNTHTELDLLKFCMYTQYALGDLMEITSEEQRYPDKTHTFFEPIVTGWCQPLYSLPKLLVISKSSYIERKESDFNVFNMRMLQSLMKNEEHYVCCIEPGTTESNMTYIISNGSGGFGIHIVCLDPFNGMSDFLLEKSSKTQELILVKYDCRSRGDTSCNQEVGKSVNNEYTETFGESCYCTEHGECTCIKKHMRNIMIAVSFLCDYLQNKENHVHLSHEYHATENKLHNKKTKETYIKDDGKYIVLNEIGVTVKSIKTNRVKADGYTVQPHERAGHLRHLKNGRIVTVKPCIIHKDEYKGFHAGLLLS